MGWGGARPGSGRKPSGVKPNPNRPRRPAATKLRANLPTIPAEPKVDVGPAIDPRAWAMMLPEIEEISKRYAINKERDARNSPFRLPDFPPAAMPPKDKYQTMAMDEGLGAASAWGTSAWLAGATIGGISGEGLLFLGYAYLSELAQRPEFRIISETIADDATRRWIDFDVTGDEKEQKEQEAKDPEGYAERMADPDERKKRVQAAGKTDKVKMLKDDQERLEVRDRFYEAARNDGFFGRSHLFVDLGTEDPAELRMPIGQGRSLLSESKIRRKSFKALQTIEPIWTYPLMYNSSNPLRADWYNPQSWFVMGQEIHCSRLQTFIGHPVPDLLKPAYSFGGLSLTQMAKPYVDIWLTTRQSVADLIHSFSVMVLMTDLSTMMQPGGAGPLLARVALFNMLRDNQGAFVVNKNTEDFKNVSASLAGLHELQAQAQEHMASVARIPLVKFTGIQPAGLNASSEGEIKVYDDTISAYQNRFMRRNLTHIVNFEQLSMWGEVDPEITIRFEQLRVMTDAEKGTKEKDDADRDQKYVDMGALHPGEVRKRIIDDPELPYAGLDPDDVPDLKEEEAEGLEPVGGRPQKPGGEGGEKPDNDQGGGAADEADGPFVFDEAPAFREEDHPRAPDGKFGKGSGGPSAKSSPSSETAGSPHAGKAGQFKKTGGGNLAAQGFKPRKKGAGDDLTQAAQVAWGVAQQTGKPQTLVMASGKNGLALLKPGERLPYGAPHVTVDQDGNVTKYEVDLDADPGDRPRANASTLYTAPTKTKEQIIAEFPGASDAIRETIKRLESQPATNKLVSEGGFKNPDGTYTLERQAKHLEIVGAIFSKDKIEAARPAEGEKPVLIMLGGRGGSGKSWITQHGPLKGKAIDPDHPVPEGMKNGAIVIDADFIKSKLPGYEGWNASNLHEESSDVIAMVDEMALSLGVNVIHDATLKSYDSSALRMANYDGSGYEVEGYYMYAAPETAATRAMHRYSKGGKFTGRFVPPEVILANVNNEKNFDRLSSGFRKWAVYDNNEENTTGSGPRLVSKSDD